MDIKLTDNLSIISPEINDLVFIGEGNDHIVLSLKDTVSSWIIYFR